MGIRSRGETLEQASQLLLGRATSDVRELAPERLAGCPDDALREAARLLGLPTSGEAVRRSLAADVARALAQLIAGEAPDATASAEGEGAERAETSETLDFAMRSKFDLGDERDAAPARFIPWSYGHDRLTAMVVDPHTLYVYWEVTDPAIERARQGLGPAGAESWINLRLYDVSGRIFDGTNALSYVDQRVERGDRQWFFETARPGSTAIVELGMKSSEGYFVKIARSGRADFPRHAMGGEGSVEWLTVHSAAGDAGPAVVGGAPIPTGGSGAALESTAPTPQDGNGDALGRALWRALTERWSTEGYEVIRREWLEAGRTFEWVGPLIRTHWEAGPFAVPVEAPAEIVERYEGPVTVYTSNGHTRVVFGPWEVVIRGLSGWAEKRVLARWEVYTSWVVGERVVRELLARSILPIALTAGGASEGLLLGASERRWLFGSEERLAGASDVFLLGASELKMLGASETLFLGASESRFRGASEWRALGASEWWLAGASENLVAGASERRLGGASEQSWGGGSESSASAPSFG
jgi:hypothetical protein